MIIIYCLDACTSTSLGTALRHVADLRTCLTCTLHCVVAYLLAGIAHSCTCHTCIPTFPKPPCMHACIHTYIYTCDFCNAQLCLRDQPHSYMSMPHMHQSHINFLTHPVPYSDEPNAIILLRCLRFLIVHSFVHSFTRNGLATICLDLLVVCRQIEGYAASRFGYGSVARFQWCICRTVMRTIAQRTQSACRYRHACVYCLHECLVCATMSFRPLTPPGASGRTRTHACTARPHNCLHVLSPGLEPPSCRSGPRSAFLVGCVVILSLS